MRLAILGATGRTGIPLVERALLRRHEVSLLVRSRQKLRRVLPLTGSSEARDGGHDHGVEGGLEDRGDVRVVEGDATSAADVAVVVEGADAVLDVTGHAKGSPADVRVRAAQALLSAMRDHGVQRIVTLTGAGVRAQPDRPRVVDRVFRTALLVLQRDMLRDSEAHVAAIAASDLRWTVVRAPRLVDAPPRGHTRAAVGVGHGTGTTLGRADLAEFLLDEVDKDAWVGQMPVVSW